ncbi:hypothetical protein DFH08DRAFT_1048206 [Mycena albidolilacea]|uniref:Uncharacterized protein n=1 Tax=Mycena albidolilacea TaxID=1033008 RepID=A0AAD7AEZ4_9AGAR|nr:hypothetical protein DFH08DRAFT_1048206 [Mycena albidolilacea]
MLGVSQSGRRPDSMCTADPKTRFDRANQNQKLGRQDLAQLHWPSRFFETQDAATLDWGSTQDGNSAKTSLKTTPQDFETIQASRLQRVNQALKPQTVKTNPQDLSQVLSRLNLKFRSFKPSRPSLKTFNSELKAAKLFKTAAPFKPSKFQPSRLQTPRTTPLTGRQDLSAILLKTKNISKTKISQDIKLDRLKNQTSRYHFKFEVSSPSRCRKPPQEVQTLKSIGSRFLKTSNLNSACPPQARRRAVETALGFNVAAPQYVSKLETQNFKGTRLKTPQDTTNFQCTARRSRVTGAIAILHVIVLPERSYVASKWRVAR